MDVDFRSLGFAIALVVLGCAALGVHLRGWRGDAQAFETSAPVRPYAVGPMARWLRIGAWISLALAAAAPTLRAGREGATGQPTLAIVLDVSMSMHAADITPSRLDEAKRQIAADLTSPFGGRLALIAFAAAPTLACPPTTDRVAFADLLEATRDDAALAGPSLAAPALARALAVVGDRGGDVLVVSDGEFPDDDRRALQDVLREARRRGVRVSAVGVGTSSGGPVPVRGAEGAVQIDAAGHPLVSRLDPDVLQWLAGEGDGEYRDLVPGGRLDLAAMAERLRMAGATRPRHLQPFGPVAVFGLPLALGIALLACDAWLAWWRTRS